MSALSERGRMLLDYVSTELLVDPDVGLDEHEEILATGRIDSMSVMRLVSYINDEFAIAIPNGDLVVDNFRSIAAIDAYLRRYEDG